MAKFGDIFEYWKDKAITEDGRIVTEIGYDGYDEKEHDGIETIPVILDCGEPSCFACGASADFYGCKKYDEYLKDDVKKLWDDSNVFHNFERAHILAKSLGGGDKANNMFLLCKECHRDSPDSIYTTEFFRWVFQKRKRGGKFLELFREALEEIERRGILPLFTGNVFGKWKVTTHGGRVEKNSYFAAMVGEAEENTNRIVSGLQFLPEYQRNFIIDALKKEYYKGMEAFVIRRET